ncbi:MAG: Mov34/MPN/PAD-1 family protein [bacterium]|nr:Mov34/MPN/PAD-1 family protein [bacterium]
MSGAERTASATTPLRGSQSRGYRYAIEYMKQDGTHLGVVPIEPDFEPTIDWTYFLGVRRAELPAVVDSAEGVVSPLWSNELGEPYCHGFRVEVTKRGGGRVVHCDFPESFFQRLADAGSAEWFEKGDLEPGERYAYRVCAYPIASDLSEGRPVDSALEAAASFEVEAVPEPIPLVESRLETFAERAEADEVHVEGEMPVFIVRSVIDEACDLARSAGRNETGGILIGHIHQDPTKPEVFVEITAQIPARHAEASESSFSFTHDTWCAADAAVQLRGRGESFLGWWHSHPRWCNPECPETRRKDCVLARPFFSADDIHLHRVCFPHPYQVSLLISDLPESGPSPALFGWQAGAISARGYFAMP